MIISITNKPQDECSTEIRSFERDTSTRLHSPASRNRSTLSVTDWFNRKCLSRKVLDDHKTWVQWFVQVVVHRLWKYVESFEAFTTMYCICGIWITETPNLQLCVQSFTTVMANHGKNSIRHLYLVLEVAVETISKT